MVITIPAWAIVTISMCGGGCVINRIFKFIKKSWNNNQEMKDRKFLGKWYELFLYVRYTRDYNDKRRAISKFLSCLYSNDSSLLVHIPNSYKMSYKQMNYILALLNPKDREQAKYELNRFLLTPEIECIVKDFLRTN